MNLEPSQKMNNVIKMSSYQDKHIAQLLQTHANQEHAGSQYTLAQLYQLGQGVPRSPELAANWLEKAAKGGLAEAQLELGEM